MTREEEIKLYLKERNIPIDSLEANSIIEGIEWEHKRMVEKACNYLVHNITNVSYIGMNGILRKPDFIDKFKEYMEE